MIINLTPHTVEIIVDGSIKKVYSSGNLARIVNRFSIGVVEGFPVQYVKEEGIVGLPEKRDGVYYIVSRRIFDKFPERKDLLAVGSKIVQYNQTSPSKNLLGHGD